MKDNVARFFFFKDYVAVAEQLLVQIQDRLDELRGAGAVVENLAVDDPVLEEIPVVVDHEVILPDPVVDADYADPVVDFDPDVVLEEIPVVVDPDVDADYPDPVVEEIPDDHEEDPLADNVQDDIEEEEQDDEPHGDGRNSVVFFN